jgi:hypothetical protein
MVCFRVIGGPKAVKTGSILISLAAVLFAAGCGNPAGGDGIPTAHVGTSLVIIDEYIYNSDGTRATALTAPVQAKIGNHVLAAGELLDGRLSITVPPVPDSILGAETGYSPVPAGIRQDPPDARIGVVELSFEYGGETWYLKRGTYDSYYGLLTQLSVFGYADRDAVMTGSYTETVDYIGRSGTIKITVNANYLAGWNAVSYSYKVNLDNSGFISGVSSLMETRYSYAQRWYYSGYPQESPLLGDQSVNNPPAVALSFTEEGPELTENLRR